MAFPRHHRSPHKDRKPRAKGPPRPCGASFLTWDAAKRPRSRHPREAMARAAEGVVGDPLTPRMLLKVAKKTASCGIAFAEQTFGTMEQKEDRMIRGKVVSFALAAGLLISSHSGNAHATVVAPSLAQGVMHSLVEAANGSSSATIRECPSGGARTE